ncbi:carbohydrate sulfotransferase 1-like [Mya arenaria]|uniref:carbohydrate sulfotransferase 1-like n=1 Tax=Mya arenaria TaxID=6604 RepID=UPI0022E708B9|nr:carbohydrate sulfotransferase 1-like [Mya arenaria]
MRSGSTLCGMVLGWHADSFYVYEPLWRQARWTYWYGNSTVCRSDTSECRQVEAGKAPTDKGFTDNVGNSQGCSLVRAKLILSKIYDCLFNDFENAVYSELTVAKLGGPSWFGVGSCLKKRRPAKYCIHQYAPKTCKAKLHRVTKVLRLTVDNFEYLLKGRDNVKVIHLFRDPRAIINSRIETKWYKTSKSIIENAKSLCHKMLKDYHEGLQLLMNYKEKFRFLYYEDLNDNPFKKVEILYKYVGMSLDPAKYKSIQKLPVFSEQKASSTRESNTAFWWRKSLDWEIVKGVDTVCSEVYEVLGYKVFDSEENMRDLTISSVDIPSLFRLDADGF